MATLLRNPLVGYFPLRSCPPHHARNLAIRARILERSLADGQSAANNFASYESPFVARDASDHICISVSFEEAAPS
eukprot:8846636-Pyramimonas_sp.AAC.1